jgi:hypothetical protein
MVLHSESISSALLFPNGPLTVRGRRRIFLLKFKVEPPLLIIEGDNWVKHGESKEFYAMAQIGDAIREWNE